MVYSASSGLPRLATVTGPVAYRNPVSNLGCGCGTASPQSVNMPPRQREVSRVQLSPLLHSLCAHLQRLPRLHPVVTLVPYIVAVATDPVILMHQKPMVHKDFSIL